MNWLAHLYLSENNPAFRLGNLLPDILPPPQLAPLPADFQRGIAQHRRIDAFTDAHPVVRRSIRRFEPPLRRFGGILCDVFFDHFLARDWPFYSPEPLAQFTQAVYDSFGQFREYVPPHVYARLDTMRTDDWLCSYQDLAGVARALERIGSRFRRPVDLCRSLSVLEDSYDVFHADFRAFFPDLQSHVALVPRG